MCLDFIWLVIWAWVNVFATWRTDTKNKVFWLANTWHEIFPGQKYWPHEALVKNIVLWLDCICLYMWSWVKLFATRGTYKKYNLWLYNLCLFIWLMDIAPSPQRQHCYGFFLIVTCIHHGRNWDYWFTYAASGGSTYMFKSCITYNALLGFVSMPMCSSISL